MQFPHSHQSFLKKEKTSVHIAIIAAHDKAVQFAYLHGNTSISRCFREIGFNVSFSSDIYRIARMPLQRQPDILAIDMEIREDILDQIEKLLQKDAFSRQLVILLYNYPATLLVNTRRFYRNTYYLGTTFTDRDLFTIASRLISDFRPVNREVPALEGEIFEESLLEVFQVLEIGKKTGCVLINQDGPFGMVYVNEGRIVYASTGTSLGKQALMEILSLPNGFFKFAGNRTALRANCCITISEILIDWARTLDETRNYPVFTEPVYSPINAIVVNQRTGVLDDWF